VEKPKEPDVQESLVIPPALYERFGITGEGTDLLLASMGIYVFNRDVLIKLLDNTFNDFGKHIIPAALETHRTFAYVFQGYWEDLGTIRAFFEANLEITSDLPRFNFFDMSAPIFTHPRWLPASKINGAQIDHAVISDGCIISQATIRQSVVGIRSIIQAGSHLNRTVMLGGDFYESAASIAEQRAQGRPPIGVGSNTRIENAIIDKNARIGDGVTITPKGKPADVDHPMYYIRDSIVIIPKNGVVPSGTVI
jgi:glucose-1-phosphate adenylyltransferase